MSTQFSLSELNIKRGAFKPQLTELNKYLEETKGNELIELIITDLNSKVERIANKFKVFD